MAYPYLNSQIYSGSSARLGSEPMPLSLPSVIWFSSITHSTARPTPRPAAPYSFFLWAPGSRASRAGPVLNALRPHIGRETFDKKTRNYGIAMRSLVLHRLYGWRRQAPSFDCALRSVEEYSEEAEFDQLNPAAPGLVKRAEEKPQTL